MIEVHFFKMPHKSRIINMMFENDQIHFQKIVFHLIKILS